MGRAAAGKNEKGDDMVSCTTCSKHARLTGAKLPENLIANKDTLTKHKHGQAVAAAERKRKREEKEREQAKQLLAKRKKGPCGPGVRVRGEPWGSCSCCRTVHQSFARCYGAAQLV